MLKKLLKIIEEFYLTEMAIPKNGLLNLKKEAYLIYPQQWMP